MTAYRFIEQEKANHSIRLMCRVLRVSRSGFYDWSGREDCPSADLPLRTRIRAIHAESRGTYGTPRVTRQLRRQGLTVNRTQGRQPAQPTVHRRRARHDLGGGHHLPADGPGLVLARRCHRPLQQEDRRLGRREPHGGESLHQGAPQGVGRPSAQARPSSSLRPRQPVHQSRLSGAAGRAPDGRQHEPSRQLLGQRRRGVLLRHVQAGNAVEATLPQRRPRTGR